MYELVTRLFNHGTIDLLCGAFIIHAMFLLSLRARPWLLLLPLPILFNSISLCWRRRYVNMVKLVLVVYSHPRIMFLQIKYLHKYALFLLVPLRYSESLYYFKTRVLGNELLLAVVIFFFIIFTLDQILSLAFLVNV